MDYLRRNSRLSTVSSEVIAEQSGSDDLERSYIQKEERIMLHHAMQSLKSDYSQILYLIFFENFTNPEAAVIMKRSDKQIRDLLFNAKKALKTELERRGFEYEGL